MTKSKHKQPAKNFFRYFVDEYILFRRDFVLETSASVEECVTQLGKLALKEQDRSYWQRHRVYFNPVANSQHFTILTEQLVRHSSYKQTAKAEGSIQKDDDGTTFVSGKVLMSGWYYWIGMVLLICVFLPHFLFVSVDLPRSEWGGLVIYDVTIFALIFFLWWQMYSDRNYLVEQIQQVIHSAEMETNLSKAKNEPISQPLDDSSAYQSHHAQK